MFLSARAARERLGEVGGRQEADRTGAGPSPDRQPRRAEVWELLRAYRTDGLKFRQQHPIGAYFADFACGARKLVIEIYGEHHAFQSEVDSRRTDVLEQAGWRVIRFTAHEAVQN